MAKPGDTVVLATQSGRAIRFDEAGARAMGRTSRGVRGIKLKGDDEVVAMVVAVEGAHLLTACENGHGKRTPLEDYPIKGRGGQGVINIRTTDRNGKVVSVKLCGDGDDVMFITRGGMIVRSHVKDVSTMSRNTQGVRLVNVKGEDQLVAAEIVAEEDLERFGSDEDEVVAPPETAADAIDEPTAAVDDDDDGPDEDASEDTSEDEDR